MKNKLFRLGERRLMGVTEIAQEDYSSSVKIVKGNLLEGHLHPCVQDFKKRVQCEET